MLIFSCIYIFLNVRVVYILYIDYYNCILLHIYFTENILHIGDTHFFPVHIDLQHLLVFPQSASVWHSSSQRPKRPGLEYVGHIPGLTP